MGSITLASRALPTVTDGNQLQVLRLVKQILDGYSGQLDPSMRVLTVADIGGDGKIALGAGGGTGGGGGSTVIVVPGGDGGYDPYTDLTTPPQPTGFVVSGGYETVLLQWDWISITSFRNQAYAEIWGSDQDVLGNATIIGRSSTGIFVDRLGTGKSRYYWVRFVSLANVTGPFNATQGTLGQTSLDVPSVLQALQGQITESQLFADLGARIDLIDGFGAGSVNARISAASVGLQTQIDTVSTTVGDNTTALQVQSTSIDGILGKYTVKIDNNGYVSGYGLISEPNNGAIESSFLVRADRFSIASPSGPGITPVTPFTVITTPTTINGVAVPVGVYMDAAFILRGSITSAQIGEAVIDSANIASLTADLVTFGTMSGERIGVRTLDADRIISRSITANEIAVGSLTALEIDTRGLTIKDAAGNILFGSGTPLDFGNVGGSSKPVTYRVVSAGFLSPLPAAQAGIILSSSGQYVVGQQAGYNVYKINRATGEITGVIVQQPLDSGTGANIAAALNAISSDYIVVIFTYDEPSTNRLSGGLPDAIYRCGGSRGVFESSNFNFRCAYMLVGIPGSGEGNGLEALSPNIAGTAWIDSSFTVVNGTPVFSGNGSSLFQINAGNASTFIANAAINSAQVGTINANQVNAISLSAITANLGIITAGLLRNAANTAVVDMNASGSGIFIHSGSFLNYGFYGSHYQLELTANGSGFMERGILSPSIGVALNSDYAINPNQRPGLNSTTFNSVNAQSMTSIGFFAIDTGIDDPAGWSAGSQPAQFYDARVYALNMTLNGFVDGAPPPLNTAILRCVIKATPAWSVNMYMAGSTSFPSGNSPSGRIYLICEAFVTDIYIGSSGSATYNCALNNVQWELYKT